MTQLIAKCWADENFKQKLLANPAATLKTQGVKLPPGLSIKAVENTDKGVSSGDSSQADRLVGPHRRGAR